MRLPGFVGGSYTSQSRIAADDRCVNWQVEKIESGTGKASYALYPTPGYVLYCTLPKAPVRGLFTLNGGSFAVGGDSIYELPAVSGGSPILRAAGLNNPDNALVTIAGSGDGSRQLGITSGSKKYSFDLISNTLTQQVSPATQIAFLDGYFIALDPNRSELSFSALEDGSTWDPLDIAQRNDVGDKWLSMLVSHKELWLFGSQTTSVYYDSGGDPVFVPNPSASIPRGIVGANSAALVNGIPMWLGQGTDGGGVVYMAQGYQPQRVSTHAVEYALSTYPTLLGAEAHSYEEQGHVFYVLTIPGVATWVYDLSTGLWHERGDFNGYAFTGLSTRGHIYVNDINLAGIHLTGSRTTGAIYRMGTDLATDASGSGIHRLRRAPHLAQEAVRVAYDRFQLDMEVGLGLSVGQGSDPQVALRWSDDGGQTWNPGWSVSAGKQGEYKTRAIWRRLGMARDRVFEVSVSDPIPWRLIDAFVDVRPGA